MRVFRFSGSHARLTEVLYQDVWLAPERDAGMAKTRFRTDHRLWATAAACVFLALGFVDPVAGVAKGDNSLWAYVARLVTGNYSCSTLDIVVLILIRSALQVIPAALLGWVVQAVVVVRFSGRTKEIGNS
jgi:hypothetical protein